MNKQVLTIKTAAEQLTLTAWEDAGKPIIVYPVSRFAPIMHYNNETICDIECWMDVAYGMLYIVSTGELKVGQEMTSEQLDEIALGKGKDSATVYLHDSKFFIEVKSSTDTTFDMPDDKVFWMMGNAETQSPITLNILEEWPHA